MLLKRVTSHVFPYVGLTLAIIAVAEFVAGPPARAMVQSGIAPRNPLLTRASSSTGTKTPIEHVIVIVGENRTFDHVFATYVPQEGQTVSNFLSKGIVNADGTPGPNFSLAQQNQAVDMAPDKFSISPGSKTLYNTLPPPNTDGTPESASDSSPAPFATLAAAEAAEPGLPLAFEPFLTTGASGLPTHTIDTRINNVASLLNGPFPLTPYVDYDDYAASPVHRFYQMWQQLDCSASSSTSSNPSGCLADLFPWVEVTIGAGSNGKPQPKPFNDETTHEGATAMAFYNVQQGDAPYLKFLADNYAMNDNFHQSIMGGTGANSVAIGTGDAIWYSDGQGNVATPPSNEIENPDPQPNTNNYYTQDGYSGGTYSNCSDPAQPGVASVVNYLNSLAFLVDPNCDPGHYYLLNNYAPGYFGDGTVNTGKFVIPPSSLRTIGDELNDHKISWKYYGEGWNLYLQDPMYNNPLNAYCDICNPFQYVTSIMANNAQRVGHLKDATDFYADIAAGTLPAVSFVKPDGFVDGHPASSKLDLFEGFVKKIVDGVQSNSSIAGNTAIFITFDEGGGYYDSGYVQPLDFFGDGTRIPLIVVSPFSRGGRVVHSYSDHVSILKFIESNWSLPPITGRSRDNLPNPEADPSNPYVPLNSPAIGDLVDMFEFQR